LSTSNPSLPMHITQRFQLLRPILASKRNEGQLAAPAGRPYERVLLWKGPLPSLPVPMHRGLGLQLSEGILDGETYWAERCDAISSLGRLSDLGPERMESLLGQVCEALLFLHSTGAVHGSISADAIGLRKNGSPVLMGIGLEEGSEEDDWRALGITWAELGHPMAQDFSPENAVDTLRRMEPWSPSDDQPNGQREVLYEVVHFAPRHRRDAAEDFPDIDTTQHGLFDITAAMDSGDATGALPLKLSEPYARASALGELLNWLYRPTPGIPGGEAFLIPQRQVQLSLPDLLVLEGWEAEPVSEQPDTEHMATAQQEEVLPQNGSKEQSGSEQDNEPTARPFSTIAALGVLLLVAAGLWLLA
jgi:hypothetical protein